MNYFNGYIGGVLFGFGLFTANVVVHALFHRSLIS